MGYLFEQEDEIESTFTEAEIQALIDWIESLTIIELAAIRAEWEKRLETQKRLQ